jgi:hypothetical protein
MTLLRADRNFDPILRQCRALCQAGRLARFIEGSAKNSVRVFDQRNFVFDSQFLAFPVGDKIGIREGAMGFHIDGFLQALVACPEALEAILFAHGSS